MRKGLSRLLVITVLMAYGCATIIHRTKQTVFLQSDPPGATATIDGTITVQTPASLKLKRGKNHHITFEKDGYKEMSVVIDREVSGWVFGNLVLGGLIGLAVDFSDGAAYKLEPDSVTVTLEPAAS